MAISSNFNGSPFAGMRSSGSLLSSNSMSGLSALFPGTTAGPLSPPPNSVWMWSMLNPPLRLPLAWHLMQLRCRIGLTSAAKSIFLVAAAGNLRGAGSAAPANGAVTQVVAKAMTPSFIIRSISMASVG